MSRRGFLARCGGAALGGSHLADPPSQAFANASTAAPHGFPGDTAEESFPWRRLRDLLHTRFRDPRRHFVVEYYPWYANDPFFHWQQWDRRPPADHAANTVRSTSGMRGTSSSR